MIKEDNLSTLVDALRSEFGVEVIKISISELSFIFYFNPDENEHNLRMIYFNPYMAYTSFSNKDFDVNPFAEWLSENNYQRFVQILGVDLDTYIYNMCDEVIDTDRKLSKEDLIAEEVFGDVVSSAMSKHKYWSKV